MPTEHQELQEEVTYVRLYEEQKEMVSEAARTILAEAESAAYAENLVHNYCFQPQEYDEAIEKMRHTAAALTNRDRKLLAKLWRAALAAAASIDSDDETPAGHKVDRGNVHWYYRMLSGMVEKILEEKKIAELREKAAELEPVDLLDCPF
jgi:hypothetical protein